MKNQATYQGTTKEQIELIIINIEYTLLNNEMEVWEAKELNEVINEYKNQIAIIDENQKILNENY
ncbi:MAG: hypothetical protein IPO21_14505 [Bacteroidales bacterium]|nr:hypothetical protein [Bacteroidales bacterium]